jgi:hypothetical protein
VEVSVKCTQLKYDLYPEMLELRKQSAFSQRNIRAC